MEGLTELTDGVLIRYGNTQNEHATNLRAIAAEIKGDLEDCGLLTQMPETFACSLQGRLVSHYWFKIQRKGWVAECIWEVEHETQMAYCVCIKLNGSPWVLTQNAKKMGWMEIGGNA